MRTQVRPGRSPRNDQAAHSSGEPDEDAQFAEYMKTHFPQVAGQHNVTRRQAAGGPASLFVLLGRLRQAAPRELEQQLTALIREFRLTSGPRSKVPQQPRLATRCCTPTREPCSGDPTAPWARA